MNEARQGREILFSKKPPVPILPRSLVTEPTLIDFSPLEIARQLTLIESELYRAIKPWELLNQSWAKKDKEKRAPRVLAMINRFNVVSNWVATIIVQTSELRVRASLQKHIIEIAYHCLSLNNFNAVMEIISGLQAASVYRLKQTRSLIDSKHSKMLEECETVMCRDQNFKNFRAYLHSADPPSIPYLGVYLTDLTFIEDGNNDNVANGLINFVKRQQVFGVINEIQQYQNSPYCLEKVDFICDWLLEVKSINEDECYKLSLIIEPRGSKALESSEKSSSKRKKTISRQNSIGFRKNSTLSPRHSNSSGSNFQIISNEDSIYSSPYGDLEVIKDYLFYEKDSPSNIIIRQTDPTTTTNNQTIIEAGTLTKLVERLTHEKYPDTNYMSSFLMTFRTFTTPNDLLDLLINRFNMPRPKNPTKEQEKNFRAEKLIPIHFRVFNVLKEWISFYGIDFKQDTVLVQRVLDFSAKVQSEFTSLASACKSVIDAINQSHPSINEPTTIVFGSSSSTGTLKSSKSTSKIAAAAAAAASDTNNNKESSSEVVKSFLDIDTDKLCSQLHNFVCKTFGNAEPREFLQSLWKVSEGRFQCIHLHRLYKYNSDFKLWIKTELFLAPDVSTRALILGKFIHMADIFSKLSDQHNCFLILTTLAPLRENELQITWEWLSPRYLSVWSRLQQLKLKHEKQLQEIAENATDLTKLVTIMSTSAALTSTTTNRARSNTTKSSSSSSPMVFIPFLDPIFDQIESLSKLPDFYGVDEASSPHSSSSSNNTSSSLTSPSSPDLINFSKRLQLYFVYLPIIPHSISCSRAECLPRDKEIYDFLRTVKVYREKKLARVSQKMNNERPEGLPPSELQKTENSKSKEGDIDDSIKPLLMQLISNDPAFKDFIVQRLSTQIQLDAVENVKKEMIRFSTISKLLLSLVLAREQKNKSNEIEITSKIAKEQYPNCSVEVWSKVDTNSSVFGWEEEISLVIIENEDEKAFVHARYHAKKADIATLLRILQFYQEENDDSVFCSLIVMDIDKDALEIATANNVSVTRI